MGLGAALFSRRDGHVHLGGVPLRRLIELEPTPFYVLDLDRIRSRLEALRSVEASIYYAVKANANVELIGVLARLGVGADVCSPGDVAFAEAAGLDTDQLSYTSTCMSPAEVAWVAKKGIFFVADTLAQLEAYAAAAPGRSVGVRVNPAIEAGFHPAVVASAGTSKFGIPLPEVDDAVHQAHRAGLEVTVLHAHLGSDLLDPEPHLRLLDTLLAAAARIPSVTAVDLGGGWGVPFTDDEPEYDVARFADGARRRLGAFHRHHHRALEMRLEPGTYLVRDAGYLVTSVVEATRRGGTIQLGVDSSTNHLPGALLFGTQHVAAASRLPEAGEAGAMVVGNLLQGGDVMLHDAPFGHLVPGDAVVFGLTGAYTGVRASTFNQRPRPAALLVDRARVTRIRRAERVEDLLTYECAATLQ